MTTTKTFRIHPYHLSRAGLVGSDLDVAFESPKAAADAIARHGGWHCVEVSDRIVHSETGAGYYLVAMTQRQIEDGDAVELVEA